MSLQFERVGRLGCRGQVLKDDVALAVGPGEDRAGWTEREASHLAGVFAAAMVLSRRRFPDRDGVATSRGDEPIVTTHREGGHRLSVSFAHQGILRSSNVPEARQA